MFPPSSHTSTCPSRKLPGVYASHPRGAGVGWIQKIAGKTDGPQLQWLSPRVHVCVSKKRDGKSGRRGGGLSWVGLRRWVGSAPSGGRCGGRLAGPTVAGGRNRLIRRCRRTLRAEKQKLYAINTCDKLQHLHVSFDEKYGVQAGKM